jgi:hypothetical protein
VYSRLTSTGAVRNARTEVERATAEVIDLESQLRRVVDPTPRRAA